MALLFLLPESLRFLALHGAPAARLTDIVRWVAPGRVDPPGTRYTLAGIVAPQRQSWGPGALFAGPVRWVTPLLWIGYAASSMTSFFFTTWGPIVFEAMGLSRATAAWALSMNSLAGAIGGLALMGATDRIGALGVALLPAAAVPFLLAIGLAPLSAAAFLAVMGVLSIFLGGSHYGIISISGTFYPTPQRALGTVGCREWESSAPSWHRGWADSCWAPECRRDKPLRCSPFARRCWRCVRSLSVRWREPEK